MPVLLTYKPDGWPKTCPVCDRETRHMRSPQSDYPRTVVSANATGICKTCAIQTGIHKPGSRYAKSRCQPSYEPKIVEWRDDLRAYLRSRRHRGIPAEGLVFPGEQRQRNAGLLEALP